jgi:hypothetical protein
MAQDFERYRAAATNAATLFTADSDDAIISIRIANITAGAVTADCFIYDGSSVNYYLVKGITIPTGSSVELIDGASRFVVESGDVLKVASNTSAALDVWVSVVDAIST